MSTSGQIIIPYGDAPETPSTGKISIYAKADKTAYLKNDEGNEYPLTASGSSGVTDHGALTGLLDDDHTQYHTDARGDARYYTQAQVDTISGSLQTEIDNITISGGVSDHGELTGLSDDEVEKMVEEGEKNAEEDKKKKEAAEARNNADSMVFNTEKMIKENK